jgi:hypothetical protein
MAANAGAGRSAGGGGAGGGSGSQRRSQEEDIKGAKQQLPPNILYTIYYIGMKSIAHIYIARRNHQIRIHII